MNGGLYPTDEIDKSYKTLERTLAPFGHPHDSDGNFLSASDPIAINSFHVGAHNENVRREGDRIAIDKVINIETANKTEKGKRLIKRLEDMENGVNREPIHTSTGVFLEVEPLGEARTNSQGLSYDWIARNMVFDHDAILLDEIGAAQPNQGVGMFANAHVEIITLEYEVKPTIANHEENAMKDVIKKALEEAEVKTNGLDDAQLLAKYDDVVKAKVKPETIIDNSKSEALEAEILELKKIIAANSEAEVDALVDTLDKSGKFKGVERDELKLIDVNTLKKMVEAGKEAAGVAINTETPSSESVSGVYQPTEMQGE